MACSGRYAEAWQYAGYACAGKIYVGADQGGGIGLAYLTDNQVDFMGGGFQPNTGMILTNTTTGLSGVITAVSPHTLTAAGVTWTNGEGYRAVGLTAQEKSTIEHYLNISAGDIQIALQSVGACNCALSVAGVNFLAHLNILLAMFYYNCPCGSPALTADEKRLYAEQTNNYLRSLTNGEIDVCEGGTGALHPAYGTIELGWTSWNNANIVLNQIKRLP